MVGVVELHIRSIRCHWNCLWNTGREWGKGEGGSSKSVPHANEKIQYDATYPDVVLA